MSYGFMSYVTSSMEWLVDVQNSGSSFDWFARRLILASFMGSILFFIGWFIQRVLKLPLFWLSVIMTLALIRFAFLMAPPSPTSALNLLPKSKSPHKLSAASMADGSAFTLLSKPADFHSATEQIVAPTLHANTSESFFIDHSWMVWLLLAWATGTSLALLRLLASWRSTRQLVRRAKPVPHSLQIQFRALLDSLAPSTHKIDLRQTTELNSPAITGFFRRTVFIPTPMLESLNQDELACILTHEITHASRRDYEFLIFAQYIAALHWFNPCIHFLVRRLAEIREMACDRASVKALADHQIIQGNARVKYGSTLLKLQENEPSVSSPAFLPAFSGYPKFNKERILQMLNRSSKNHPLFQTTLWGSLILILICGTFTLPLRAQSPKPLNKSPQNTKGASSASQQVGTELPDSVPTPAYQLTPDNRRHIPLNQVHKIKFPSRIAKFQIENPSALFVRPVSADEIEIQAKKTGEHIVLLTDEHGDEKRLVLFAAPPIPRQPIQPKQAQIAIHLKRYTLDDERFQACVAKHPELRRLSQPGSLAATLNDSAVQVLNKLASDKVLELKDQPVLATEVGQNAQFISGGEVPIPTPVENGHKIEFRPFGVIVNTHVKELNSKRCLLEFKLENTELVKELSNQSGVPGFRTRRVNSSLATPHGIWSAIRADDTLLLIKTTYPLPKTTP